MAVSCKHGYFGLSELYNGNWTAGFRLKTIPRKGLYLGTFPTKIKAARAVYQAAKIHRPDLNLPDPDTLPELFDV